MLTVRGYRWPACVTHASLALLASYSGRTEETIALDDEARARGVSRLGLSTGGELGARWSSDGVAWRALPSGMPPRAALYASWLAVTRLLGSLGWLSDPDALWREAARSLRARVSSWGLSAAENGNPAKQLARELIGRPIVIYAESRLEPIATRWRNQINENAKLLGHSSAIPELNHNEVVGWERAGDPARGAVVVILRDGLEAEPNVARLALTAEFLGRQGVRVLEPEPPTGGALARAVTLAWLGDLVSFYLAMLNGVDPTPVAALDEFKRRLSERRVAARGRA
jgi:glucose/mannose-6-phosphate isomerase